MGYLNNQVITVDAILTNKGRELLAKGNGDFNITQFALSDDEIDYTLYNPTHPSGSAYYGEAIQNMPLMEAFPDESQMMKYKLVTLPRGTQVMPILAGLAGNYPIAQSTTTFITPSTSNYLDGAGETAGYSFTISDVRVCQVNTGFAATGIDNAASQALNLQNSNQIITNGTSVSQTVIGTTLAITGTGNNILFGTLNTLYATLTIIGLDSGARAQVPINVTRTTTT
jgi:hypothetical protein|tara:strand:+ start:306 stop:986 length:681 start_codon:yes stop_codon:yes gene_type:complete